MKAFLRSLCSLPRLHKTAVHMVVIAAISVSIWCDHHAGPPDYLFLVLAMLVEVD